MSIKLKLLKGLLFSASLCVLILFSCNTESPNSPVIDNEKIDFQFIEFDKQLFELNEDDIEAQLEEMASQNPAFTKLFFESILPMKDNTGQLLNQELMDFVQDPFLINLQDTVDLVIDKNEIRNQFAQAFQYSKHYFPQWNTPNIYLLISGFAYQRFLFEDEGGDAIGVGVDFFLGSDYPYKKIDPSNPSFSAYLTRTFNEDHLVKKALEVWVEDKLPPLANNNLVAHMINNGKKIYILDKLLPGVSDTVIMEYTSDQLAWAKENELEIWSFFFSKDLFYESNMRKINKYINPSPDSPGMPAEAPGRIANYMGWRIVDAYMDKHPDKSMEMLLLERDAQKILDGSKYKPKKK